MRRIGRRAELSDRSVLDGLGDAGGIAVAILHGGVESNCPPTIWKPIVTKCARLTSADLLARPENTSILPICKSWSWATGRRSKNKPLSSANPPFSTHRAISCSRDCVSLEFSQPGLEIWLRFRSASGEVNFRSIPARWVTRGSLCEEETAIARRLPQYRRCRRTSAGSGNRSGNGRENYPSAKKVRQIQECERPASNPQYRPKNWKNAQCLTVRTAPQNKSAATQVASPAVPPPAKKSPGKTPASATCPPPSASEEEEP